MEIPDAIHIPKTDKQISPDIIQPLLMLERITLQRLKKSDSKQSEDPSERSRAHHATVYLPEGTTANHACIHITERQNVATGTAGIWLLQSRPLDEDGKPVTGADFENIKDSKHLLSNSNEYVALYYTGPDIYLM